MPKRSRAATAMLAVATTVVSLLVTALVLEGVLRIGARPSGGPAPEQQEIPEKLELMDHDPVLGWVFRPGASGSFGSGAHPTEISANELGMRSPGLATQQDARTRILVLGDSYGFGWGVDEQDSFPRVLDSMLQERYPRSGVAVLNACIPGYGLYQQRAMLESVLEATDVHAVVSTYSLSNDPLDDLRILRFAPDRLLEYSPQLGERNRFQKWLVSHSALLGLIDHRTSGIRFKIVNSSVEAIGASERCMRELFSACAVRDLRILQLQIPHRWEIMERAGSGLLRARSESARQMRESVAAGYGVVSVDAAPALRGVQEATGAAYLVDDAHWTAAGHRAVAEALLEAIPADWLECRSE